MEQFISMLASALRSAGIPSVRTDSNSLCVCNTWFYVYKSRGRTVRFGNDSYRWPYNINKAVEYVLKELPKSLKQRELYEEHSKLNQCVQHQENITFSNDSDSKLIMQFSHEDKSTIMAAADLLQDSGFCDESTPKEIESRFIFNQIQRMFHRMNDDDKRELVKQLYRGLSKEDQQMFMFDNNLGPYGV